MNLLTFLGTETKKQKSGKQNEVKDSFDETIKDIERKLKEG